MFSLIIVRQKYWKGEKKKRKKKERKKKGNATLTDAVYYRLYHIIDRLWMFVQNDIFINTMKKKKGRIYVMFRFAYRIS